MHFPMWDMTDFIDEGMDIWISYIKITVTV